MIIFFIHPHNICIQYINTCIYIYIYIYIYILYICIYNIYLCMHAYETELQHS